jgi:hypothetical protein
MYTLLLQLICYSMHASAAPPSPQTIWDVKPEMDWNDPLYAGWEQIPAVKEVEIYNGVKYNRTYAHHPELHAIGDLVFATFSSAPVDEDSMGQDVWVSVSKDSGLTWDPPHSIVEAAILPNQTDDLHNFKWWCDRRIAQRVWQPLTFVELPDAKTDEDELYVVIQSASRWCPASFRAAGRIAQRIDRQGQAVGNPCWLEITDETYKQLYHETVYGTKYGMKMCPRACEINRIVRGPDKAPAWSTWLYNTELYAADGKHSMQEQTHGVWFNDTDSPTGGYWQRFWRDISGTSINTLAVWVEFSEDREGRDWYPRRVGQYGNNIFETNIPDAKTKQFFGTIEPSGDRYFISNPKYNATHIQRQPLTLATSRGLHKTFQKAGVLRTNARDDFVPDTRDGLKGRAHGFSYPSAIQVGDKLLVSYSENKENIWVSVVDIKDLP